MAELFRFRCYQCEKLIGAPASRFGKIVKCPNCSAELIVPSPDDRDPTVDEPSPDAFRPEDFGLRLEPEPISRPSAAPLVGPEPVGPDPVAFLEQVAATGEVPGPDRPNEPIGDPGDSPNEPNPNPGLPEARAEPLVPRKRGRRGQPSSETTARARDVVLPRTAAVAWSLFALLALAFAFTSGLFVGRNLWK